MNPINIKLTATVKCRAEVIWDQLIDFSGWSNRFREIEYVQLNEPPAPAVTFIWKAGGQKYTSLIREVKPNLKLVWTSTSPGIRIFHRMTLNTNRNVTEITAAESLEGLKPLLLKPIVEKQRKRFLKSWLIQMKNIACSR